jgi:hypothetical protein
MAKGKKTGGRTKGTLNKATEAVLDMLARIGCNPLEGLALISTRRVSCGTCVDESGSPTGRTRYQLDAGTHSDACAINVKRKPKNLNYAEWTPPVCTCEGIGTRVCLSCFGSLRERIGADLKFKADSELAQYVAPKRKSIEVSGEIKTGPSEVEILQRRRNQLAKSEK